MDQISPGLQSALASWVNTKNMQPIVDKITPLIWTDINIVNADSIIVASSKPYRIGKYHNAAHMLLDTDQDELIIEHTNDVPGVLHGVNYPMIINGARVGMIGITGVPSEVQLIARLVRELLQVSISQARKDQEKSYLDQERYMFLFEWLFNQGTKDDHDFEEKGRALGIAVQEPWVVCAISLFDQPEHNNQQFESIQSHAQRILDEYGHHEQSICVGNSLYLLLDGNEFPQAKARVQELLRRLVASNGCTFPAGVGSRATGLSEVRQSLRDAKVACRQSSRDPEHPVCRYDELDLDLVVAMVPQREKQQLLARVFGEFSPEELAQTMQMLRVYTQFNGSISQAAEALHIHKNSLQYRLNRLARRLNICACAHRSWGWGRFGFSTPAIRRRISAAMSEAVSWSFAARCAWAMLPKRPRQDPEWSFPS